MRLRIRLTVMEFLQFFVWGCWLTSLGVYLGNILTFLYTMFYMPTLGLANTIAFNSLKSSGMDVVKDFPPIRVWGTVGFILAIPFFLRRYGIKTVMLLSITAWALRFAFFGIGNPGNGFTFLVLSMIVYGMVFDFFNVSGSLFVEQETSPSIRAGAQGIFILMTNGIGTMIGTLVSGLVVDYFTNMNGEKDWPGIWFCFAGYALVLGIFFMLLFKKDNRNTGIIPEQIL